MRSSRIPHDFSTASSEHSEDGELFEGALRWRIAMFDLDLGYSEFTNEGSFGFDLTRAFARVGVDFTDSFGAAVEYETNEYNEDILQVASYDAERIAVFLRFRH